MKLGHSVCVDSPIVEKPEARLSELIKLNKYALQNMPSLCSLIFRFCSLDMLFINIPSWARASSARRARRTKNSSYGLSWTINAAQDLGDGPQQVTHLVKSPRHFENWERLHWVLLPGVVRDQRGSQRVVASVETAIIISFCFMLSDQ